MGFEADVKTGTRSHKGLEDKASPDWKHLDPAGISGPTALAGASPCIDGKLVHGDMWNQIEGNVTTNILKNRKYKIFQNDTGTVTGNLVYRVVGTTNDTRVDVHNQTNMHVRNDTFIETRSETHHQPEHRSQKTEDHDIVKSLLEWKERHFEWKEYFVEVKNISLGFCWPLSFEKHLMDSSGHIFKMEGSAIEVEFKEIKNSLGALGTEIKGGKIKAAATHMKAIAGNINAGIALNADSPFG